MQEHTAADHAYHTGQQNPHDLPEPLQAVPALWVCALVCRRQLGSALGDLRCCRRLRRRHRGLRCLQICNPLMQPAQQRLVIDKPWHVWQALRVLKLPLHCAAHAAEGGRPLMRERCRQGAERCIASSLRVGQRRLQRGAWDVVSIVRRLHICCCNRGCRTHKMALTPDAAALVPPNPPWPSQAAQGPAGTAALQTWRAKPAPPLRAGAAPQGAAAGCTQRARCRGAGHVTRRASDRCVPLTGTAARHAGGSASTGQHAEHATHLSQFSRCQPSGFAPSSADASWAALSALPAAAAACAAATSPCTPASSACHCCSSDSSGR